MSEILRNFPPSFTWASKSVRESSPRISKSSFIIHDPKAETPFSGETQPQDPNYVYSHNEAVWLTRWTHNVMSGYQAKLKALDYVEWELKP